MKLKIITFCMCALASLWAHAQTVTTFSQGTPDDAIVLDSNGNIYCSQYTGDTVFKFTPAGDVESFVTGLNTPNGLEFNSNDELYVCDGQGNTIYRFDSSGTEIDSYPISGHPSGIIKFLDEETMYFTRFIGNTINILETDGTITTFSSDADLNGPVGLAMDGNGTLYVGNYTDRKIFRVLGNGDLEYIAQLPSEAGAFPNLGFITYAQGKIWGTVLGSHKIYCVDPDLVDVYTVFTGSTQGSMDGDISEATFSLPNGIAFNDAGDTMYVTDFGPKNLRIISGILSTEESQLQNSILRLSPNPAQDRLVLEGDLNEGTYTVSMYTISGQLLSEMSISSFGNRISEELNISNLQAGVYLVKISDGASTVTQRMIKK
ncbi:SMP-30/gluconolactonase/LRE family protein [Aureisphaera galaxeae]|uniref:virginiamycin B lyase family protein n=1 Tax=Aureisphaera galaxeae TaxID=1538023 RepID=UPI00234FC9A4|nr:SMP-30/gluconolactonase/LRE family protein [Aureisphaera galaxeae]MDC8006021.1 SMP-30/gluconolactonase/LRE family protein [Aureisphaera galaxeae]